MPIYEYTCSKCNKTIEVIQKMSDKPLRTHAGCGGKLTKQISRSAFQLKGTGWYVTDYGSKSKGDSGDSAKSESSESKSESTSKATDTSSDSEETTKTATSSEKPAPTSEKPKAAKKKS